MGSEKPAWSDDGPSMLVSIRAACGGPVGAALAPDLDAILERQHFHALSIQAIRLSLLVICPAVTDRMSRYEHWTSGLGLFELLLEFNC